MKMKTMIGFIRIQQKQRIYKLILDNINLDQIKDSQVETEEINNIDSEKFLNYINEIIDNNNDETEGKINDFTNLFKIVVKVILDDIQDEFREFKELNQMNHLWKLSSFYYLYQIQIAEDINEENKYAEKINDAIDKIILNKEHYYTILEYLGQFKNGDINGDNKNAKLDAYFKILFYLNGNSFSNLLTQFMNEKKTLYYQYGIPLPSISFEEKDYNKKLKFIYNILYILKKSESFKTNERFEYINIYTSEPELLEEINYILNKLNKKPLNTSCKNLDNNNEGSVNYPLINTLTIQTDEDIISEYLKILEEGEKKQEKFRLEKKLLEDNYNEISLQYNQLIEQNKQLIEQNVQLIRQNKQLIEKNEQIISKNKQIISKNNSLSKVYTEYLDKYNEFDNNYSYELGEFKKRIATLTKKLVESNEKSNKQVSEIKPLKKEIFEEFMKKDEEFKERKKKSKKKKKTFK